MLVNLCTNAWQAIDKSNGIVTGNNGQIITESRQEEYTVFRVYFPVIELFRQNPKRFDLVITDL
ncbi:hypothetical protein NY406_07555 [Chlorobaculum sp. MV4-Y]|uniref:hypothetical protein n=1 Tax=Chlorobaculum sp. MV4-Y TaxID=2976335 RepID=UPI0021AEF299|nr:hypothetical protein [Chlorobaculum sp. MV4-Y]UWX57076.1 hypothetical protein NY406_07555 [Chlorobaculum sp. MV4-Y]